MSDERYERSADMRLLELQREALGVPAPSVRIRKYADFDPLPEVARDDDDDGYAQHGAVIVATLDAQPRRALIPGAVVTISLAVVNEGDKSARGVHVTLPLPSDAAYRTASFQVDGRHADDATALDLQESGFDLGEIEPNERRTLVLKIELEAALGDVIVTAHVRAERGAILGPRALRLTRPTPGAATLAQRPFYEDTDDEGTDDETPVAAEIIPAPAAASTAKWKPDPLLHSEPELPPPVARPAMPAPPPQVTVEAPAPNDASTAALAQSIRDAVRRIESVRSPDDGIAAPPAETVEPAPAPIPRIVPFPAVREPRPAAVEPPQSAPETNDAALPVAAPRSGPSEAARRLIAEAAKRLQAQTAAAAASARDTASSEPAVNASTSTPPLVDITEPKLAAALAREPATPQASSTPTPTSIAALAPAEPVRTRLDAPSPTVIETVARTSVTAAPEEPAASAAPRLLPVKAVVEQPTDAERPPTDKPARVAGRKSQKAPAAQIADAPAKVTPGKPTTRGSKAVEAPPAAAQPAEIPPPPRKALKPLFPQTISGLNRDVPERPPAANPADTKSRPVKRAQTRVKPAPASGNESAAPAPVAPPVRNLHIVRSTSASIRIMAHGGPLMTVHLERKRLATLTMLFSGPSLGMIAHYLLLNALAAKDALPEHAGDAAIGTFIANQERLLSRALITTRLGKSPSADSLSAPLPSFPPAVPPAVGTCEIGVPTEGLLLVRAFQPTDIAFLRRTLANEKAAPFLRAAQLFVGLCANDAAVVNDDERRPIGAALSAYAALATAEISRIFLRSKLNTEPVLFKATDAALDDAARAVLNTLARTLR